MLMFGNGERPLVEVAHRLAGEPSIRFATCATPPSW
jgi:radical SAM superfamily enzyme YgiQ (UPF0313 family)